MFAGETVSSTARADEGLGKRTNLRRDVAAGQARAELVPGQAAVTADLDAAAVRPGVQALDRASQGSAGGEAGDDATIGDAVVDRGPGGGGDLVRASSRGGVGRLSAAGEDDGRVGDESIDPAALQSA